jgi:hypothetical protein
MLMASGASARLGNGNVFIHLDSMANSTARYNQFAKIALEDFHELLKPPIYGLGAIKDVGLKTSAGFRGVAQTDRIGPETKVETRVFRQGHQAIPGIFRATFNAGRSISLTTRKPRWSRHWKRPSIRWPTRPRSGGARQRRGGAAAEHGLRRRGWWTAVRQIPSLTLLTSRRRRSRPNPSPRKRRRLTSRPFLPMTNRALSR